MENKFFKLKLSDIILSKAEKEIKKWKKENPKDSLLNIAQQVNYSSVLLKTIGAQLEEDHKKNRNKMNY